MEGLWSLTYGDLLDNDCDDLVDAADSDCTVGVPQNCSYHTDCYPEGVCAEWAGSGQKWCSDYCAGDTDCDSGMVCSKLPGSANVGYCHIPPPGTLTNGSGCSDGSVCASETCVDSVCVATCLDEAHCPGPSNTCALIGDPANGIAAPLCLPNGTYFANGVQCLFGGNANSAVCASGHCDLMIANPDGPFYCAPLCKTQSDCAPNQECGFILYMDNPHPLAVLYDPIIETAGTPGQKAPRDAALGCYTRVVPGGAKADGLACTSSSECIAAKCIGLLPGDNTTYCTRHCEYNTDCANGMACKLEMINIISDFLTNFGTNQPSYWTYVGICKFE